MLSYEPTDNLGRWHTLSQEHTIWESEWGQVCLFSGCSGRFYDLYDPQGVYVTTTGTLDGAKELLRQNAGLLDAPDAPDAPDGQTRTP